MTSSGTRRTRKASSRTDRNSLVSPTPSNAQLRSITKANVPFCPAGVLFSTSRADFDSFAWMRFRASISPDGSLTACGMLFDFAGPINVFDVANTNLVRNLPHALAARPVFSPNGKWLLTGDHNCYSLWDIHTWEKKYSISREDNDYCPFVAFSPDSVV